MRFLIVAIFFMVSSLAQANFLDLEAEMKARGGEVVELEEEDEPVAEQTTPTSTPTSTASEPEVEVIQQVEVIKVIDWCATGKNQSPVNLDLAKAVGTQDLAEVEIAYRDMALRLLHQDGELVANYPLGSYIKLGQDRYELLEYRFKIPSEHQVNGFKYPLEIQMLHKNGAGNHLALAVLVAEGDPDEYLQLLLNKLPKEKGKQEIHENFKLNPARFLPDAKEFFYYSGSLTTGSCDEGTAWLVFQEPIEASVGQLMFLHKYLGENARELQPLNGRVVIKSWQDSKSTSKQMQKPAASGYYFEY